MDLKKMYTHKILTLKMFLKSQLTFGNSFYGILPTSEQYIPQDIKMHYSLTSSIDICGNMTLARGDAQKYKCGVISKGYQILLR